MKTTLYTAVLATATILAMTNCAQQQPATERGAGIRPENMNTEVAPGTDFYQYACGGWIANNPLKPEYARYGSFDALAENNREQIKGLIEELAQQDNETGSLGQKIGDLYAMLMDSVRQNEEGISPIQPDLEAIAATETREQLLALLNDLSFKGVQGLWHQGIGADMMDSKSNLVEIWQGGLSLGQKEYYLSEDSVYTKILAAYRQHLQNVFRLLGDDETVATRKMENVVAIETRLARASKARVELRDPASNYHKISYDDLKTQYGPFDWDAYFHTQFIDSLQELCVGQPEALKEAVAILNDTPVEALKDWAQWQLVNGNANLLGDELFMEHFDFFNRTMSGQQEPQPRWKRSVGAVSGVLGEAVGQMYVEKYFPAENKERMLQLVANLQEALAERIDAQDWMSDSTKAYAKEKLAAFYVKIGYPDKWKDYNQLSIDPQQNLYETMQAVHEWAQRKEVDDKYGKPVDPDEWFMTPQTVNAYYNPTTNEICFPAGILQYPFFDMSADDAFNYGAIGVVIGHEMTHGFDDSGRQFDKEGNFRDWWAAGDDDEFKARAQVMADFFSQINVLPDLKCNGQQTLGENLADHGGLQVAYTAFKNAQARAEAQGDTLGTVDGLTPDQRFFIAYAGVWAQNITDESIRDLTTRDTHSIGEWRVNGALPHIDAWYEAFGIGPDDPLYVPKEQRVTIW